jgi:nucleotide-binding universal stress UspA family protein
MFERIIVPLDGSRLSAQALPYAMTLAQQFKAAIMLLRVVSNNTVHYIPSPSAVGDTLATDIISEQVRIKDVESTAHAKRYLMNRAKEMRDHDIDVSYHVMQGSPANSIMEFATKNNASLIVMMSHGRGRFKRAILGSVADALIRRASFPILVIRAKDTES